MEFIWWADGWAALRVQRNFIKCLRKYPFRTLPLALEICVDPTSH